MDDFDNALVKSRVILKNSVCYISGLDLLSNHATVHVLMHTLLSRRVYSVRGTPLPTPKNMYNL